MKPRKWSRLSKDVVFSCAYFDFCHDRYQLPTGEAATDYYYIDIPGSTMVVPLLANGELVFVRQYRYPMGRQCLELPAGGLKRGVLPLANAQLELQEEAGLMAHHWDKLGEFAPCNGLSNELCYVYLATNLEPVTAAPEPTEELEVVTLTLPAVREMIKSGELWDGMTIASLCLFEARLEDR